MKWNLRVPTDKTADLLIIIIINDLYIDDYVNDYIIT